MTDLSVSIVDDFLSYLQAWATAAAAAVTVVTLIVLALQVRDSRKSVRTTLTALADARKARIDDEMPRLTVEIETQSPAISRGDRSSEMNGLTGAPENLLTGGNLLQTPENASLALSVVFQVTVWNDGPRRAVLSVEQPLSTMPPYEATVGVDGRRVIEVRRTEALQDWIEHAKANEADSIMNAPDVPVLHLTYVFPGNTCAIERHTVTQSGSIVERVIESPGTWKIRDLTSEPQSRILDAIAQPFEREYFASIKEGRPL
jgi:hypothetical protein